MGNTEFKEVEAEYDSDDYWWIQLYKTFAAVESCDEFCRRFNTTPAVYDKAAQTFEVWRKRLCPEVPYITREAWLAPAAKKNEGFVKWFELIWNALDYDGDGQLTLGEFLVYKGVSECGTKEQKIMGFFMLCDQDRDRYLSREEMCYVIHTTHEMHNRQLPEEKFQRNMDILMNMLDKEHTGVIKLSDVIKTARINQAIAVIFTAF